MRIACVYLPSFPLQVHVRLAPHRANTAFAISDQVDSDLKSRPAVLVCSRAARAQGVKPGMSVTQARALAPDVDITPAAAPLYRSALESLAETMMAHSVTVDVNTETLSAHQSIYLRVPSSQRGDSFGRKLIASLSRHGYRGRVGVADDRFSAWIAAATAETLHGKFTESICTVPRGGAAAFLRDKPIELLPLPEDIRTMLVALGIRTMGDFADLPPPSIGRRWNENGVDYQRLARGDGSQVLRAYEPQTRISETTVLDQELSDLEPLIFVLRPLADRVVDRLRGRGSAAAALQLQLRGSRDTQTVISIEPPRSTRCGRTLLDLLRARLIDRVLDHPVQSVELIVTEESEPENQELDLFDRHKDKPSPEALDIAIARIEAIFGEETAASAELTENHKPEQAFRLKPFSREAARNHRKRTRKANRKPRRKRVENHNQTALPLVMNGSSGALRLLDPPRPLSGLRIDGTEVVASRGPTRIDTDWWTSEPTDRDYYEVETEDGGRYWVFRTKGQYYLHGIFD